MIRWILGKMEHTPNAVFYRRELEQGFPEGFQQALQDGLLIKVASNFKSYSYGLDTTYRVVQTDSGFEAIDEDEPETEPIPLSTSDFLRYRLNLDTFAKLVQNKNGLTGKPFQLNERLFFIGEAESEGKILAYVLVFVNDSPLLRSVVVEAPSLLSRSYHTIIAIYPNYLPDPAEQRRLEDLGIWSVLFDGDTFVLPSFQNLLSLSSGFSITDSSVTWRGKEYPITQEQSAVIKILYEAYLLRNHYLAWKQIQARLESYHMYPARMSDVFKVSPLWNTLIIKTRRSLYSLNI